MRAEGAALAAALLFTGLISSAQAAPGGSALGGAALYGKHCAECHGEDRLGRSGPALLPETLSRLRKKRAAGVIAKGRPATQMPAFAEILSADESAALLDHIFTPVATPPVWTLAEMRASHRLLGGPDAPVSAPVFEADPLNLFVVVESGDHHVTILDGDRFTAITRFKTRSALHGGPKFTPDGRFVFFGARDGWVTKYDLYGLRPVAEIRAGINTRNIALSHDGKFVAVANYLPHTLVMLDAGDLSPIEVIPARDFRGKKSSRVSAVYQAAPRKSFIAAFKDIPELWEIFYGPDAPVIHTGLVHSNEQGMTEALAKDQGAFPVRRVMLSEPLDDFFFDPSYRRLMGTARDGGRAVVVHLDVRREIAELALSGFPHLGSGITWTRDGRRVMATPHIRDSAVSVIDVESWTLVKRIETLGPGFFMRSHENSPYAWVDVFFGPNKD
ncbi:MAG: cytochrome D1 domain-containing protein, partial [Alphaproteobacteria bacterium]